MAGFVQGKLPMEENPSAMAVGVITVGTVAVAGPDVTLARDRAVVLTAEVANTASVFVGRSDVATDTGFEITPGGGLVVTVKNLNALYFISSVANQKVRYAVEVA